MTHTDLHRDVDINCDMGEGMPTDSIIMPYVSSVNIACGYHAGDHNTMARTVALALEHGVSIGAHPGLPDRSGFGRRAMSLSAEEIRSLVLYQVGALWGIVSAAGGRLTHVKPHGALYHMAEADPSVAGAIVSAVYSLDPALTLVGLSGGRLVDTASASGLTIAHEVFADREYRADGSLVPRGEAGALINDAHVSAARIANLLRTGRLTTVSGDELRLRCDTVCIHGDSPDVAEFAPRFVESLNGQGIAIRKQDRHG